jgi:hypothetical protein
VGWEPELHRLMDVDKVGPRMLSINERRFCSVRYFNDSATGRTWFGSWMTTIVDANTG